MLKKLYRSVDSKITPSESLIKDTKEKLYKEINSKKVTNINFYKYATLAACFVIFIGVLSVNMSKVVMSDNSLNSVVINESINNSSGSFENNKVESDKNSFDSINTGISGNPFNASFNSAVSTGNSATVVTRSDSFIYKVIGFFSNIIQWFRELLF